MHPVLLLRRHRHGRWSSLAQCARRRSEHHLQPYPVPGHQLPHGWPLARRTRHRRRRCAAATQRLLPGCSGRRGVAGGGGRGHAGPSWRPVPDGYLETGSIGAIRVADTDPNIIYVGTGSDGIRSNVIQGRGVYQSTGGAKTWHFVGLKEVGQIGAVVIHPRDPNLVYIAAQGNAFKPTRDRGVYRSKDGGKTWQKVLFLSDSPGAPDLEMAPDNPNEIYASMWRGERKPWTIISGAREGGIYKSSDGGDTWTKLTNGLPKGLFGKSDLAVSPADARRVYALIEAPEPEDGLYRSDDRGQTWQRLSSYNPLLNRPFNYTNVDADPTNADVVYVNDEGFFKSVDGGQNRSEEHTSELQSRL